MSWGLVAVAGATLVSGVMANKSAGKAADAQVAGSDQATAEQRRQFDITQENLKPFQQTGLDATEQQRILLGLGSSNQADPNAQQRLDLQSQIDALGRNTNNLNGGGAQAPMGMSGHANPSIVNAMQQGRVDNNEQLSAQRADLQAQLGAIPEFTPLSASEQQQQAFDQFNLSPGQQFLRDRAQKNLLRNSAAIGGLGGGNVRSALVEQGVGFAQQDFNNQFGRLGQLAGQGQNAATSIGQFGQQTSNNISNNMVSAGNARASGLINQSNAQQNTIGGLANVAGQYFNQ